MNYLQYVDNKSPTIEALRKARTFNDITGIIASIKISVYQIRSKILKKLSKLNNSKIELGNVSLGSYDLSSVYEYIRNLRCYDLELDFSKSVAFNINGEEKKKKFDTLSQLVHSECISTLNLVYKYLDQIGSRYEPKSLLQYTRIVQRFVKSNLKYSSLQSFVLPSVDHNASFNRYIILFDVQTKKGFIVPSIIVGLTATYNEQGNYYYALSFPVDIDTTPISSQFSSKESLVALLEEKFSVIVEVDLTESMPKLNKDVIYQVEDVDRVYVDKKSLFVELESGTPSSGVNAALTKLLPLLYTLTGVSSSHTDVIHRVSLNESGNRVLEFAIKGRSTYSRPSLNELKKAIPINKETLSSLINILGK